MKKIFYVIPSIITFISFSIGYYGLFSIIKGNIICSCYCIFLSTFLDNIDGRVARLFNTQTGIGKQLDSFADMLCFGILPSLILYHLLNNICYIIIISILYSFTVVYRLSKFNIATQDKDYFIGLPCPISASFISSIYILSLKYHIKIYYLYIVTLYIILAFLMLSNYKYYNFKNFFTKKKILLIIFLFICILFHPIYFILIFSLIYISSGIFYNI